MKTTTSTNVTRPGRAFGYVCPKASDSAEKAEALVRRCQTYVARLSQRPDSPPFKLADIVTDATDEQRTPLLKRPHGYDLDTTLQPGDMVVFASMDRSANSSRDLMDIVQRWQSKGIAIHFADDIIADPVMRLSPEEQQRQQELTMAAMQIVLAFKYRSARENRAGKHPLQYLAGPVPVGYRVKGRPGNLLLELDPVQTPIIKVVIRLRDEGLSWWRVCDQIEEMLAQQQDRRPLRRWQERTWSRSRCCRAYKAFAETTGMRKQG